MADLPTCVQELEKFTDGSLRLKLRDIEGHLTSADAASCGDLNASLAIGADLLDAAATVKRAAAQIDVLIHSIGILHLLPAILAPGERVQYLSLGAGNTGKKFDLETNAQIAEFTFIAWRGGSEAIRQSKLFVDFFHLAEAETTKARRLYVLGMHYPAKFFRSRRTLVSVLSRRPDEAKEVARIYGDQMRIVSEYHARHEGRVELIDVAPLLPPSLLAAVEMPTMTEPD